MKDYKVSIISSLDQFEKIARPWNELLAKSICNNVFLTWEWQFSWAECFLNEGRHLFILTIHHNDQLVGVVPCYINRSTIKGIPIKQVEFLGTPEGGCDYLDVFIRKGAEKAVTEAIYEFLFNEASHYWDCLQLIDIRANSLFLLHLLNKIAEDGKYLEITKGSFCPFAILPPTKEEFYGSLSPNRREQFRRHRKLLNSSENIKHISFSAMDDTQALDEFFTFYENEKQLANTTIRLLIKTFLNRCENSNTVQVDMLSSNGHYIAAFLHLCHGDTMYMYLMAVNKAFNPKISIGNVLVGLSMEKGVAQGFSVYDFLKGTESYKFHWAKGVNTSLEIYLSQRKAAPILLSWSRLAKNAAKLLFR